MTTWRKSIRVAGRAADREPFPSVGRGSCRAIPRRSESAFTMIEIAMAIGIIGFALVAIIGILPTGLNVQKDNREDSIVNSDANLLMQAMRTRTVITNNGAVIGAMGRAFDFFTNYVDGILISNSIGKEFAYTNPAYAPGNASYFSESPYVSQGAGIIGLLSTPAYLTPDLAAFDNTYYPPTNYVRAWIRSMNGSASEQNGSNSIMAFRYVLDMQITPHSWFSYDSTNYTGYNLGTLDYTNRFIRWNEARCLNRNLYDVEMSFHWPVLPNVQGGPNHQTFRGTITGCVTNCPVSGTSGDYFYFQPLTFTSTNLLRPLE